MPDLYQLTRREWQVVELLLQGRSNKMIATALGISSRTVEFHLKNAYAKCGVGSRVELILKLGKTTGTSETQNLRPSTVAKPAPRAENEDISHREPFPAPGKEPNMKTLLRTPHAPAGALTALLTGLAWLALMQRFGHASPNSTLPWVAPVAIAMIVAGGAIGWLGGRNGHSAARSALTALLGAGFGSIVMLPLTAIVLLPLGKLAEALGLVNRASIPLNVIDTFMYGAMLAMWLAVAVAIGAVVSRIHLSIGAPHEKQAQA